MLRFINQIKAAIKNRKYMYDFYKNVFFMYSSIARRRFRRAIEEWWCSAVTSYNLMFDLGCESITVKQAKNIVGFFLSAIALFLIIILFQVREIYEIKESKKRLQSEYIATLVDIDTTLARELRRYRRELLADKQFFSGIVHNSTQYGPCIETLLAQHKAMIYFKSRYYEDSILLKDAKELQVDYEKAIQARNERWRKKWGYNPNGSAGQGYSAK